MAAEAFGERALLCLRTNPCRSNAVEPRRGASVGGEGTSSGRDSCPDCLLLDGGDPTRLPGFADGWFAVQDQASAFVVQALGVEPGSRVFDACAAPGGKSAQAACLAGIDRARRGRRSSPGADVVDPGDRRAARRQDRRARAGRDPAGGAGRLRPRPRRRALLGPRIGPATTGALVAVARRAISPASPDDRSRSRPRRPTSFVRGAASCTPSARSLVPKRMPSATRSADIVRRWSRPMIEGPRGRAARVRLWPHRDGSDGMFVAAFTKRG